MAQILVIFMDGVGLGRNEPQTNPLARNHTPSLVTLLDGRLPVLTNVGWIGERAALIPVDALLGTPGLPQSGTGQTTILTGVNAAYTVGRHYGPYPPPALLPLLADSLFGRVLQSGRLAAFANAFPDFFLDRVQRGKGRLSANARAALLAGLPLRSLNDLQRGEAISALLTNDYWLNQGYDAPAWTARQAGSQLARLSTEYTLTYFEFWLSDVAGHRQDFALAERILRLFDEFIAGVIEALDLERTTLAIISDHGNMEDLTTPKHTLNPAFGLFAGAGHETLARRIRSLPDISPALQEVMGLSTGMEAP